MAQTKDHRINTERLLSLFTELVSIDSPSFSERQMADRIEKELDDLSINWTEDESGKVTGSTAGNIHGFLPGVGESVLFCAHMDTVQPGIGKKAVVDPDGTIHSDGTTVLGADDLAAVAGILECLRELTESDTPHRPVELLFTTAEEAYTAGASAFDLSTIRSREAFCFDLSDAIGSYSTQEPTLISYKVRIRGKAAHAGFEPEKGISSILAAANAIAKIRQGRVNDHSTLNIGLIQGGSGTNVVPEETVVEGELRSAVHEEALELLANLTRTFEAEARAIGATAEVTHTVHLTAYQVGPDDPALIHYQKVLESLGIEKRSKATFGGSDVNVFRRHGLSAICAGNAMHAAHTTKEYTNTKELEDVAGILYGLAHC
ncbi:MAG: M20/M25/M40 family metallo-hydrolase [Lachnospiraceae bacterium]|jgi:tripeptide aminopeptidase